MLEFFEFIVNLISSIVDAVATTIESVVALIGHIVNGYIFLHSVISNLPPFCQGALLTIVGISLLTVLLGAFLDFG